VCLCWSPATCCILTCRIQHCSLVACCVAGCAGGGAGVRHAGPAQGRRHCVQSTYSSCVTTMTMHTTETTHLAPSIRVTWHLASGPQAVRVTCYTAADVTMQRCWKVACTVHDVHPFTLLPSNLQDASRLERLGSAGGQLLDTATPAAAKASCWAAPILKPCPWARLRIGPVLCRWSRSRRALLASHAGRLHGWPRQAHPF
jgi:hypothetical protein